MAWSIKKPRTLYTAKILYWLLLGYIIAALVWWFISLEIQNTERAQYEIQNIGYTNQPLHYTQKYQTIRTQQQRRTAKHISEGLTFMLVICIGAVLVYRAVRKQLQLNKQQQNFILAVTHELKTPIAISKLNIQTLQKRQLEPAQKDKLLHNTLHELQRLNDLATNILVVSQVESKQYALNKVPLVLNTMLQHIIQEHAYTNCTLEQRATCTIQGDALLMQLVIHNILDNAVKYSPKDAHIHIIVERNKLMIQDSGIGLPKEEHLKIFEKFYRVGNENTRTTKGTGLGLYLCKKILQDHYANITVSSNTTTGCTFTILYNTTLT